MKDFEPEVGSTRPPDNSPLISDDQQKQIEHMNLDQARLNLVALTQDYERMRRAYWRKTVAASVQQEPPGYPLKLNQAQLSTMDEWVNDPKNLFGDREARAINLPIFARQMLSCQPAAPRTQGRELEIKNLSAETLLALAEEMLLATWDKDFKFSFSQVRRQMVQFLLRFSELAQARTRPDPSCPKCGSPASIYWMIGHHEGKCNGVNCGYSSVHWEQFFTALPEATNRDERQKEVAEWCAAAFGADHQSSVPQRAIRMLEEAIEAYQSATMGLAGDDVRAKAHALVDHVMSRLAGNLAQECGGVGVTLLALCEAAGVSADTEELREIGRVKSKPLEHFHQRNQAKNEAGFDLSAPSISASSAAVIALSKKENE